MSKLEAIRRATGALLAACSWATSVGCQEEQRVERRPLFQSLAIQRAPADKIMRTIAFGSCAHQDKPQPIWEAINELQPDLFLLLGDNIYADTRDMDEMRSKYAQFGAQSGFRKLCEACPILATWDDHDYGENDAGANYPMREESQQIFYDFFGEPASSPRRQREGVYDSRIFGPPGRRVQIILLDTRYFRSRLARGGRRGRNPDGSRARYMANTDTQSTILGQAQWVWLEQQLQVEADLRIMVSSIQVVSEEHGFEKWMNFPHERQRLCDLIRQTRAGGIIVVSGDRHKAELSRLDNCADYPLYDLTSSALNRPSGWYKEINRHRIGSEYRDENFGVIRIAWDSPEPTVSLQIHKLSGEPAIVHDVPLSTLRPASAPR